jgi:CDP-2,3-bis-(O-geranylgeranyl)-sn-glycerol synthase
MFISALYFRYWGAPVISIETVIIALVSALWIMLPAYIPNSSAAAFGGGAPIDGGKNFRDGRRLFGSGKTWRGLILGIACGVIVGAVQISLASYFNWDFFPVLTMLAVFLLATGALLGDLGKSFFKRRLGKKSGDPWPVADQYDLVAGAFLLTAVFDPQWFFSVMTVPIVIIILIITPLLHRATNIIGYLAGVKEVPW